MEIKKYIEKIGSTKNLEDMKKLGEMLEDTLRDLRDYDSEMYDCYKTELYEMAYGEIITKEEADDWVMSMQPYGKKWTIEETTDVMKSNNYNVRDVDFYVACNMMYNDYYDIVKEDEGLAIKMAYDWLNDTDAVNNKLYKYRKYIVSKK